MAGQGPAIINIWNSDNTCLSSIKSIASANKYFSLLIGSRLQIVLLICFDVSSISNNMCYC
ncbi:6770_t:CDS:2 [Funneliformis mosseae]|uniref:6770_t:CDS:1 n=1 Tax=Funneliformis mosseae TaxID=27381 RepID=A0A9N9G0X3_FUNMO|nr:6770_t:CDS:2 [Funneliformis mosseae]